MCSARCVFIVFGVWLLTCVEHDWRVRSAWFRLYVELSLYICCSCQFTYDHCGHLSSARKASLCLTLNEMVLFSLASENVVQVHLWHFVSVTQKLDTILPYSKPIYMNKCMSYIHKIFGAMPPFFLLCFCLKPTPQGHIWPFKLLNAPLCSPDYANCAYSVWCWAGGVKLVH